MGGGILTVSDASYSPRANYAADGKEIKRIGKKNKTRFIDDCGENTKAHRLEQSTSFKP